uniref:Fibrinogen C-terminal domain-containing protein n=1 Tax=Strongyloides venezuelensis TaxID=75913 RepID=A0A0K0EXL2_STRVS
MRQFLFGLVVIGSLLHIILGNYSLSLLLQEYDVGMGYLNNGSHCNPFWFTGLKCNIQLKICISLFSDKSAVANCQSEGGNPSNQWIDLGQVSNNSNSIQFGLGKYKDWINPLFITSNDDVFAGFSLSVEAYNINGNDVQLIDSFTHQFAGPTDISDSAPFTHIRNNSLLDPTLTKVSWIVSGPVLVTTTQKPKINGILDCNDSPITEGKLTLNYTTSSFDVYCDPGNNNSSYTVIQARGPTSSSTDFNKNYTEYEGLIGTIEKNGNFWIGLKNMNTITSNGQYQYAMRIDLCCGNQSIKTMYYSNFVIGDTSTNYLLTATPLDQGIGLGYGPSGIFDINATFSTPDAYTNDANGFPIDFCDILVDPKNSSIKWGTGGWWYGSCGNNLNGKYIPNNNGSCSTVDLTREDSIKASSPGIEMSTSQQQTGTYAFDGISYDKVRMALYRSGNPPTGTKDFCIS